MLLDPAIANELKATQTQLLNDEKLRPLLSEAALRRCYDTFAAKFGPEALRRLDGVALLEGMFLTSNKNSLVYWLEYKDDDEFPGCFGSIAGGNALKFGLYRRKETGLWTTGSATQQRELSEREALEIARRSRDQLIAAAEVLTRFRSNPNPDGAALQQAITTAAPEIAETAWGHKYLSLLFPDQLDDYHAPLHQRYHLIKLLQTPPTTGRYTAASAFVAIAHELGMPLSHLSRVLNERDGSPHFYYRIGTSSGNAPRDEWPAMRDGNFVAIGWPKLKDLGGTEHTQEAKDHLKALMGRHYPNTPPATGKAAAQVFRFVTSINIGDIVLAADGKKILAIGRVKGDYAFAPGVEFCHRRAVDWLSTEEWDTPVSEGLLTTVHLLAKPEVLIEIERRLLSEKGKVHVGPKGSTPPPPLEGIPARIEETLLRKGQVILNGPPGTGKTYWAQKTARELAARSWFGRSLADLNDEQRASAEAAVVTCTFHPAYGYEDFLEGFRPVERSGTVAFELRDGIFKKICSDARASGKNHYLVIDEINRGDIPRIFGELITLLENSKRDTELRLPLSGKPFSVPKNVFVLGTMNTADRSIALLDAALRRRFGFVELLPDSSTLEKWGILGLPLGAWLDRLNERILKHVERDARNLQIGHSYLMHDSRPVTDTRRFAQIVRDDLVPLLEEYCYEDYETLEKILGPSLVNRERRRINDSLFRPGAEAELIQALLATCPELQGADARITESSALEADVDDAEDDAAP